jgi:5'(3')-deoxyribonucleotidase
MINEELTKSIVIDIRDVVGLVTIDAISADFYSNMTEKEFEELDKDNMLSEETLQVYWDRGYTKKSIEEIISTVDNFYSNLTPAVGCTVDLLEISKSANIIFLVDDSTLEKKIEYECWLMKTFPKICGDIPPTLPHTFLDENLSVDYVISTSPSVLKSFNGKKLLLNMPYNTKNNEYFRIKNWAHFLTYLRNEGFDLKLHKNKFKV